MRVIYSFFLPRSEAHCGAKKKTKKKKKSEPLLQLFASIAIFFLQFFSSFLFQQSRRCSCFCSFRARSLGQQRLPLNCWHRLGCQCCSKGAEKSRCEGCFG